LATQA